MTYRFKKAFAAGILISALAGMTGCVSTGYMTRQEAVVILDHALTQSGCNRQDIGVDSSYVITTERFLFQSKEYEVTVDTTHDQDRVEKSYRRGRKKNEHNINIPWSAVTRVIAKGSDVPYGESRYQAVQFFFMTRDAKGEMIEDSYTIDRLVQNADYTRDAVSELSLAIKTLSGLEPAARGDYARRYSADDGTAPAWKNTPQTSITPARTQEPAYKPPREPSPTTTTEQQPDTGDATERELRKLADLHKQGLISDEVYKERQMEILKAKR